MSTKVEAAPAAAPQGAAAGVLLESVTFSYEGRDGRAVEAVADVSLRVEAGEQGAQEGLSLIHI